MKIEEWFKIGMKREIVPPLPIPLGEKTLILGAGNEDLGGTRLDLPDWDGDDDPIPEETGSVSLIWANHFFEHLRTPLNCLGECQRVLKPGGQLNIVVPHAMSELYADNIDHHTSFSENTFKHLFQETYYNTTLKSRVKRWQFRIHTVFILGIVWRNMSVFYQLVKEDS